MTAKLRSTEIVM